MTSEDSLPFGDTGTDSFKKENIVGPKLHHIGVGVTDHERDMKWSVSPGILRVTEDWR